MQFFRRRGVRPSSAVGTDQKSLRRGLPSDSACAAAGPGGLASLLAAPRGNGACAHSLPTPTRRWRQGGAALGAVRAPVLDGALAGGVRGERAFPRMHLCSLAGRLSPQVSLPRLSRPDGGHGARGRRPHRSARRRRVFRRSTHAFRVDDGSAAAAFPRAAVDRSAAGPPRPSRRCARPARRRRPVPDASPSDSPRVKPFRRVAR